MNKCRSQNSLEKGRKMIIFGCGGHARSIVNVLDEIDQNMEIIFVDENAKKNETILGHEVVCEYEIKENDNYIIAFGENVKRREFYNRLLDRHIGSCSSVISASSHIGMDTEIGIGTFIASGSYVGPQVKIGNNTIINTCSVIEHEVRIGNHTHIAPNATICGRSCVGDNVFCGAGSIIIDNIIICDNVVVGAGAVVKEHIKEYGTYVGVPARKID